MVEKNGESEHRSIANPRKPSKQSTQKKRHTHKNEIAGARPNRVLRNLIGQLEMSQFVLRVELLARDGSVKFSQEVCGLLSGFKPTPRDKTPILNAQSLQAQSCQGPPTRFQTSGKGKPKKKLRLRYRLL